MLLCSISAPNAPISMAFEAILVSTPYTWFFLSGVFFAAAVSRMTRSPKGSDRHDAQKSRKWSLVSLGLFFAVVMAVAGVFIPGADKVQDIRILFLFGGTVCLVFAALRFKKAVGLPLGIALVLASVVGLLFFQSFTSFTGETGIATVRVLFANDKRMSLEVMPRNRQSIHVELAGEYFAPVVKIVIFDDLYIFLGSKTWYRFEGITSFSVVQQEEDLRFRQEDTDHYFSHASGISRTLYGFFERYEEKIPGVKSVRVEIDLKRVRQTITEGDSQALRPLERYSIRIQNDGGVQIIRDD